MISGDVQASQKSGLVLILNRESLLNLEDKDRHGNEAGLRESRDHFISRKVCDMVIPFVQLCSPCASTLFLGS